MKDAKPDYKETLQEMLLELKISTDQMMKKLQAATKKNRVRM